MGTEHKSMSKQPHMARKLDVVDNAQPNHAQFSDTHGGSEDSMREARCTYIRRYIALSSKHPIITGLLFEYQKGSYGLAY